MTPRPWPLRKLFEPPGVDYDRPRTSRTRAGLGLLQIGHAGRFVPPRTRPGLQIRHAGGFPAHSARARGSGEANPYPPSEKQDAEP